MPPVPPNPSALASALLSDDFPNAQDVTPLRVDCEESELFAAPAVRELRLLTQAPWTRPTGGVGLTVQTEGWKFPAPPPGLDRPPRLPPLPAGREAVPIRQVPDAEREAHKRAPVRSRPAADTVLIKDRLLCLLQPPLTGLFAGGGQLAVPFEPFQYQLEGIAFLLPRQHALLADEMGLGKTAQAILTLRLLFHRGEVQRALLIAPKPLIHNWARELALWAPDLPFEIFPNDPDSRRTTWRHSNCPLKLINYESLTRDADIASDEGTYFDVVILDEAQRIKNAGSKTAEAVKAIPRGRSWALTGTPIENHASDLVNIFSFVQPGLVPQDTPIRHLARMTSDCILRRTKDDVQSDMPPRMMNDVKVDLTPGQRRSYDKMEKDSVADLNDLGDTVTVQHVFQVIMRLKQICNFDPRTGESAKLERLLVDMQEVASSGQKALIFSQWVEPLLILSNALKEYNPLQYHGRIPQAERTPTLDRFKADRDAHVLLMTYGTGSVGLNLQFTNYVFLFDRWWNPAVEDQAINRAHRIGQTRPVTVTRFLSGDTIETRIADILEAKRQVFAELLDEAQSPSSIGLSEDEIFGLFDLKKRRH